MKYVAVFIISVLLVSNVHAKENLDGKALVCDTKGTNPVYLAIEKRTTRYFVFRNEWMWELFISDTTPLKIEEMNWRYDTYPNEIKFIFFVLNRKSLKLVYTFEGREMDFQCRSSTPKEIERTLNQKIDELRARMKKNKL